MRLCILTWSLLLLFGSGLFPGCVFARPLVYVAKSVSGQVVDADSGQPLEAVIITINWQLTGGMHRYPQGQAHVDETVTDAQGRFTFPGWGPQPAPVAAHLYETTPQLLFFKSGYEWNRCVSALDTDVNTRVPLYSDCDNKIIKLKKFTDNLQKYSANLHYIEENLHFVFNSESCEWKQIPRMLIALDQEKTRLLKAMDKKYETMEHAGITYWDKSFSPADVQRCGLMKDFLRSYLK